MVGGNKRRVSVAGGIVLVCVVRTSGRSWRLVTRVVSFSSALQLCMVCVMPFGCRWEQAAGHVGGGIDFVRVVALGVLGFSSLVVLHIWAPGSCLRFACFISVVGVSNRRVSVVGCDV